MLYQAIRTPKTSSASWMPSSAARWPDTGSKSWKNRIRTWMRLRDARIQPNTASHTIRNRDSSSVQISGLPAARVTTPSVTQPSSAIRIAHATTAAARSNAAANARNISALRAGDLFPEPLAPLRLELRGQAREHRFAEALDVGRDHVHPARLE